MESRYDSRNRTGRAGSLFTRHLPQLDKEAADQVGGRAEILSPMPGKAVKILAASGVQVAEGETVGSGTVLVTVEQADQG